jgi:predicted DNA-binding transcriptional regulator AlpA
MQFTDNTTPAAVLSLEQARKAGRSVLLAEAQRALRIVGADPMLSKREVAALRGVSISTIDRMVRRGEFPPGEMVSPRKRGWRLSVVQRAPGVTPAPAPRCRGRKRRQQVLAVDAA